MPTTTHGASCAFVCDPGYDLAGGQPSCLAGRLSASAACVPRDCSARVHAPANGGIGSCAENRTLAHGEACALTCLPGYTAAGLHLQFTGSKRANGAGLGDDSIDVVAVQPLKQRRVEKGSYLKTKP